jgi:hypothetical protein
MDGVLVKHPRMSAPQGNRIDPGEGWHFLSHLHRFRWSGEVEFRRGETVLARPIGRGSIVAFARIDRTAAICVRRGDKRPWEFEPPYELLVLSVVGSGMSEPIAITPIDISERCWTRRTEPAELVRLVRGYMDYALGGPRVAIEHGARDVRLELRELDSDPVIELSFELPHLPDVRLVRIDKPVNELGHRAGLGDLNILLEEDLAGSNLIEVLLEDEGPVDGRLHF